MNKGRARVFLLEARFVSVSDEVSLPVQLIAHADGFAIRRCVLRSVAALR